MTYHPTSAQAAEIQRKFRSRWHEPMRQFLATQGTYVKSAWIIGAWIEKHPKFMGDNSIDVKQQSVGRILGDLLPKYTGQKSGGRKCGVVFINTYSEKQGITIADIAKECEA